MSVIYAADTARADKFRCACNNVIMQSPHYSFVAESHHSASINNFFRSNHKDFTTISYLLKVGVYNKFNVISLITDKKKSYSVKYI